MSQQLTAVALLWLRASIKWFGFLPISGPGFFIGPPTYLPNFEENCLVIAMGITVTISTHLDLFHQTVAGKSHTYNGGDSVSPERQGELVLTTSIFSIPKAFRRSLPLYAVSLLPKSPTIIAGLLLSASHNSY